VKIPSIKQIETWDTDLMVKFVKKNWAQDSLLNLEELQLKTVVLICLATMARPRSDVGRLRMMDIRFKFKEETELEGAVLHFRIPNEDKHSGKNR
jgi:hypothetical protein